jgi:NitT/TauT family transport system permease protein
MTTVHRIRTLSILTLLGSWLLLAALFSPTIIPGPVAVTTAMWQDIVSGDALFHLSRTLLRVVAGLALTMVLGIAVGTAMGLYHKGEVFLEAWVMVGLTVPAIVYGIICLLWFGLNDLAAIVAIAFAAYPAVAINVWQGIKGIDTQLVSMGTAFRLGRGAIVRKIIFPQLIPHLLAAVRYALGICWKICTTVELIGMSSGVGYMLSYWFGLFSMRQVFAWTFLFLLVMFAIEYMVFKPLEKRWTRWRAATPLAASV